MMPMVDLNHKCCFMDNKSALLEIVRLADCTNAFLEPLLFLAGRRSARKSTTVALLLPRFVGEALCLELTVIG